MAALGAEGAAMPKNAAAGLNIFHLLDEWQDRAPETPPGNLPVEAAEAEARLQELLGGGAENREEQADYAISATAAFLAVVYRTLTRVTRPSTPSVRAWSITRERLP